MSASGYTASYMAQQSEPRFVAETEADPRLLEALSIAIVGYGNLGRSLALNLRDSGAGPLTVGEVPGPAWEQAAADGFPVSLTPAAAAADVVFLLVPDESAPGVYQAEIAPSLRSGATLVLASGFNLAFGQLHPAQDLDVLLIAPRMLGPAVRELYQEGLGFPSFVSVEQDSSGRAWATLCALAKAIGALKASALVVSAAQEAQLDLFVEQTVGPDLADAILTAFQVGVEAGLPPEALVMELYMSGEMARTFGAMAELGFFQQVKLHGFAAAFGGMARFIALDRESRQRSYRETLADIANGTFARALLAERDAGYPSLALLKEMLDTDNQISRTERLIRSSMRLPRVGQGRRDGDQRQAKSP